MAGLSIEPHKRAALSLACLSFALVGIPLGITARRRETSNGMILSLLIAAAYFSGVLLIDEETSSSRTINIVLFWLPNTLLSLIHI